MEDAHMRPPDEHLRKAYDHLFNSGISFSKLRDSALADRLFSPSDASLNIGIAGRSIAWKLFLVSEEPLQSSSSLRRTSLLDNLRNYRQNYVKILQEEMRAPDGSYEEGFVLPGLSDSLRSKRPIDGHNLETNNPLSLHDENPWREWFSSVELRKTILQDVERTFPDIVFFRDPEVQFQLTNILFLYSTLNPTIGYRQGMHEILAPLFYALDYDSIAQGSEIIKDDEFREICSRLWVAADAWALFTIIMRGLSKWYEWREPSQQVPTSGVMSTTLPSHVHLNVSGQLDIRPHVTPIVEACNRIQATLLRTTDPLLWKHMQAVGIEPQIYGIRWLRLLFTREFSMKDSMKLWDGLFACDPTFELALWVCVAMLIRIRNELIPTDYSGQLTVLLRYPSPQDSFDGAPHHTSLLLRQALALQMSPTPSTGVSLMIENHNLLNIPLEVPAPPPAPRRSQSQGGREKPGGRPMAGPSTHGHSRQQISSQMGLPEMIARGLLERGESLGINKTLMSAVSELRRNIPDLAASLGRSPSPSFSTFPLTDDKPPEERPPWEPRTRFEMERDISHLRTTNKQLGEALGWIVDVLLQDETEVEDRQRLQKRKREALESLSYVRDVLNGNNVEIEEARLLSEEEVLKRSSSKGPIIQPSNPSSSVAAPVPVPVIDSRQRSANSWTHRSRSPPQSPLHTVSPIPTVRGLTIPSKAEASLLGRVAPPWNHTRSSFSGSLSSFPAETLPRLPPPTLTGPSRPSPGTGQQKISDQTPHRTPAHNDPLGALR